ncbi:MAG: phospholipase D-like domain-containing protein [Holophagales bacterium]|jgi:phosphatidylserine/phosphatidylglycerophosphate/cardiolipin synthase-like enzyme|nr:phospholipase D-like domain-containing protein [Holophagales bacterium]
MRKIIPEAILILAIAQTSFGQTPASAPRTGGILTPPAKTETPSAPAGKTGGVLDNNAYVRAHFAPDSMLAEEIVREIAKAKNSIMVQAYKFTSNTISQALSTARKSGVTVEVILDKDHKLPNMETLNASAGDSLLYSGVPVHIDSEHVVARNNLIIIDDRVVITGSYSFTDAEKMNAENIVIIDSPQIAGEYAAKWAKHKNHSTLSGTVVAKAPKPAPDPKPTSDPRPSSIKSGVKRPVPPAKPKSK